MTVSHTGETGQAARPAQAPSPTLRSTDPYLQLDGITVRFPGVLALDQVSLDVRRGEVHGLMGENGAHQSAVHSVLSGVSQLGGVELLLDTTKAAIAAGVAII